MFGFNDKSESCWRCCTALLTMPLTHDMGFPTTRSLSSDEKTALMGVLSYYIAGTQNAGLARKMIKRYVRTLPASSQGSAENIIQEIYSQTRMTAENTMGTSLNPLIEIISENVAMLEFICAWPSNETLEQSVAEALANFYLSVSRL